MGKGKALIQAKGIRQNEVMGFGARMLASVLLHQDLKSWGLADPARVPEANSIIVGSSLAVCSSPLWAT